MLTFEDYLKDLFKPPATKITGITDNETKDIVDVASTCLSRVEYDLQTGTLTVTFTESGATYDYYNVPESEYENLVQTIGSIGLEYNESIKGLYHYQRVG